MLLQAPVIEKVIGHRGASAYAPENTLAAFDKALSMGCRFLEFDVMLSADGEPFVFHDESLKRTTNGQGQIGLVTAEYLQTLDAGSWFSRTFRGEKIPHFREVLKWLTFANVNANIEIKPYPGQSEQTAATVLSFINRYWPANKAAPLVSSFDRTALTLYRSLAPEMPIGLLFDRWEDDWQQQAEELQCYSIHLNHRALNADRVGAMKEKGYLVLAYTVNRKRLALKLFDWGVDAVFSDYPDLLL
ncbi:glycerophosphodiester phosphodiesterase [Legionella taurinensis]|uniref:Glycerophosphodiester phosphodiesterase n=1 Tax=Legionella taurinensis TaxID=70611 RepID=A0A3A5L4X9_9GAMM|nr:glycerophosphodiester phosphodiesterase [Legionella taurinensis]RJT47818.1 glycerophosphodiester phosphodiesterase [Legionella taurinensis]RJT67775.1 glycerophosphodiester phosphodiesterase [Legionella taurinensis]STY25751.1 glycerophosphoryl diester phosphodiesterase [Legionella taurinensis]